MGPDGDYTIFRLKDRDCGATYTMRKEYQQRGVPPSWLVYIAVENADESTKRAVELGAKVLSGPFDVMDKGRMSIIEDPMGAHLALWQGITSTGIGIAGEDSSFCWADLNVQNREPARKFYAGLFGWKFVTGEGKDDSTYWHIMNGEHGIGGVPPREFLPPDIPSHWMIYYMVVDCDASFAKATSLGAKGLVPPMAIEGAGRMAVLDDPQGAGFALFQPSMK